MPAREASDIYQRLVDVCERHDIPFNRVGKLAGTYRGIMREMASGNPILGRTRERLEAFVKAIDCGAVADKSATTWSPRDDETLRRLWCSGLRDDVALADALGRSPRGIRMRRHKLDLKFTAREIAKKRAAIIQAAKPTRDWPAADDRRLAEMLRDGLTSKEIALKLGRTERAIFHRRNIVKPAPLPVPKPKTRPTSHYDREVSFREESSHKMAARLGSEALAKAVSGIAIPAPAPKRRRTFEELLAAVEAGEVRVVERPVLRAPEPAYTMAGVVGDYSI